MWLHGPYYVRTWKRRDEPRGYQIAQCGTGKAVSREFKTSPVGLLQRMNADWERYRDAMMENANGRRAA